jgi:hypothetical protein
MERCAKAGLSWTMIGVPRYPAESLRVYEVDHK